MPAIRRDAWTFHGLRVAQEEIESAEKKLWGCVDKNLSNQMPQFCCAAAQLVDFPMQMKAGPDRRLWAQYLRDTVEALMGVRLT